MTTSYPLALHERTFRAMNTNIQLLLLSNDARRASCVLDATEWFFLQVDWRLSRFRASSELSTLNRQGQIRASRMLLDVLQQAARANADTEGLFNPLIGPALIAAGYDRTFDDIGTDHDVGRAVSPPDHTHTVAQAVSPLRDHAHAIGRAVSSPHHHASSDGRANSPPYIPSFGQSVVIDADASQVYLRGGAQLDLGGIAKGWAIDRAFRTLSRLGPCCVNAGGDVRTSGSFNPDGRGWRVDIADPFSPAGQPAYAVLIRDRAVATSGITKRRWRVNGVEQHHLIDPRSAQPARSGLLLSVTVIATSAVQAEVAAKVAFILGEQAGSAWLDAHRLPALLMFRDGESLCNAWFPQP
jgi:thiamine biosynthesis lipoprotein